MFGEKKADCPFWRGACKEHQCRLYIQVKGLNPGTGEQINRWGCSFEFLPMLLIENSQQQRQTGASVDSFRNEMVVANAQGRTLLSDIVQDAVRQQPKLIS
mgnify:CR=1 FL=1